MSDMPTSSSGPAASDAPRRKRRGWLDGLIGTVLLIGLVGGLITSLFWAAGTPEGTAWLLAALGRAGIGIEVQKPQGSLIGEFSAQQIVIAIAPVHVVIERPRWQGLSVGYTTYPQTWAAVHLHSLAADRITVSVVNTGPPSNKPFALPAALALPLELQIDELHVAELQLPGLDGHPLRELSARLHLGAEEGRLHRIDALSVQLDPLQITGDFRLGAQAPMQLDADLKATQAKASIVPSTAPNAPPAAASGPAQANTNPSPGKPRRTASTRTTGIAATPPALPAWAKPLQADWQAQLQAHGPLARFNAKASLHAQGQQLDASAIVAPAQPWPLPQLDARTQSLDLAALLAHAPATALSGSVSITPVDGGKEASNASGALNASIQLSNEQPGRWNEKKLPLRSLAVELKGRTDQVDRLDLTKFEVQLSDGRKSAGSLQGSGQWSAGSFELKAQLGALQPSALDPRLAAMSLSGPIELSSQANPGGENGSTGSPTFKALIELAGKLESPARAVQLKLDASGTAERIELHQLRAAAGGANASFSGTADHAAQAWQVKAQSALVDFDPRTWFPELPGVDWQAGVNRINLRGNLALTLPDAALSTSEEDRRTLPERLTGVRGETNVELGNSLLAGVPLSGDVSVRRSAAGAALLAKASLDIASNALKAEGQLAPDTRGTADHWTLDANAPALAGLGPLLDLLPALRSSGLTAGLKGTLTAQAQASGRWPDMTTQGQAKVSELHAGPLAIDKADLNWQLGSSGNAPLEVKADVTQAGWGAQKIGASSLQLKGTTRAHELSLRSELKAAAPAWVDGVQPPPPLDEAAKAAQQQRTLIVANARGSLSGGRFDDKPAPGGGAAFVWKGTLQQLEMRSSQPGATPLLLAKNIDVELQAGDMPRLAISAGRADIVGAGLRWDRIEWQAGVGVQTQHLDLQAELEPLAVAPLLRRIQPNFGWGGDLLLAGKVVIRQTPEFTADIVLERKDGDLSVTDETGTQTLGLTDLRLGLDAHDGVWSFTQGLAGKQLGVAAGALVVHTSPMRAWPDADAPVQGVLEAQVANLGTWGAWVPAGWRLDGRLNITASLGGRFNAREYTGEMKGSGIGARNLLLGVNVTDGEVDIALQGDTARINKLTARAGAGTVRLEGDARLGESPRATLQLIADKFQVLGRVDRRIVTSGRVDMVIDPENLKGEGKFTVDEGLIDFTRSNAPSLGNDVVVTGRSTNEEVAPASTSTRNVAINLELDLGKRLALRGRGIDTRLEGELKLTTPGGKLALNGSVSAVDGTYAAYGQKLTIDRGVVIFNGAIENPRIDIEATRPNLDVRVGVAITGPLLGLRVRLFSEPDLSNAEKLSWLMLGRASDGLGRQDTALLQRAALALLSGEGEGVTDQITKAIGIDDVSVRQTEGEVRETVVGVGKQLSRRVYIGYEQSLNSNTAGSFQVTYRIAQRFLARLQSGTDRSLDLIWTWRWE